MISPTLHKGSFSRTYFLTRAFSSSRSAGKNNKVHLKSLGSVLSKGKVGEKDRDKTAAKTVKTLPQKKRTQAFIEEFVDAHADELEESSFKVGYMSKEDIKFQEFLDSGRQFGGSGSGSVLRRIATLNSLPETIDILKTPWEEIERVYRVLKELDDDQGIHHKYKKRLGIDTKSLIAVRHKKLTDMCKFARRDQKRQMSRVESAFESVFHYNVIGFDRSLGGIPLQTGKHAFTDKKSDPQFPVELLEDSWPFETTIPIHKKEVNFMEDDALAETLMPHDIRPAPPEDLLSLDGKPIMVQNTSDYKTLEHLSEDIQLKIEEAIYELQNALSSEITRGSTSIFSDLDRGLKRNEYMLVSRIPFATKYSGPTFKYSLKFFDLVPFYGTLLTTVKHERCLLRHLRKVVNLNLSQQIDSLMRVKYKSPNAKKAFLKRTKDSVRALVRDTLLPMIQQDRIKVPQHIHAVIHKQVSNSSFSRIYWVKRPKRLNGKNRRPSERRQAQYIEVGHATDI